MIVGCIYEELRKRQNKKNGENKPEEGAEEDEEKWEGADEELQKLIDNGWNDDLYDDLLKQFETPKLDIGGASIAKIDKIIHRWANDDVTNKEVSDSRSHIDHQKKLINFFENLKTTNSKKTFKKIFQDETVYNKKEGGRMRDILRACYFILYHYLLEQDIKVNSNDVYFFIGLLFNINFNFGQKKFDMPEDEFNAIKSIMLWCRLKRPKIIKKLIDWLHYLKNVFSREYSKDKKKLDNIIETTGTDDERAVNDFLQKFSVNSPYGDKRVSSLQGLDFMNALWEYHPDYMDSLTSRFSLSDEYNQAKIDYILKLMTERTIDLAEEPPIEVTGGSKHKHKKRSSKRAKKLRKNLKKQKSRKNKSY